MLADDRAATRGQPGGSGEHEHREAPQRVVGAAGEPAAVGAVDRVGRVDADEDEQPGDEGQPREARAPARAGEHGGQEGQQGDVGQRVGGAGDGGAAGGVEMRQRRLQRRGGGDRSEGQAAEQPVEPHAHAAAREALAAEQDDAGVEAEVGAEPQRVAERGHRRPALVGDEVDQPAAAVQQDAERPGTARRRARPAPMRRGPGTGRPRTGRRRRRAAARSGRRPRDPALRARRSR